MSFYKLGQVQLVVKRKTPPAFATWEEAFLGMDVQIGSVAYWRGDLMTWGSFWYGDTRATSVVDPAYGTVKTWENNLAVCSRVPPDRLVNVDGQLHYDPKAKTRRRRELRYSHTAEVAYLDADEQARFLNMAVENNLSVRQLRQLVKGVDVSPEGSAFDDLKSLQRRIDHVLEAWPAGWNEERQLLLMASGNIRDAIVSAENRKIGKPIINQEMLVGG
jgi:hypothetical protein